MSFTNDSDIPNNNADSPQEDRFSNGETQLAPRDCATVDCLLSKPVEGLQRKVGLFSGVALIVGTIIGSGIFASPRYVMEHCGSVGLTLVVWALCGVLGTCGALCYAELGTAIPLSGAEYSYLYQAFGPLSAFLYSWTAVVVLKPSQVAIICLAFGAYVIEPFFPGCSDREDLAGLVKILAAVAIGIITFVNCASVKWATRMQIVFTAAKLIAMVMLIVTGLLRLAQGFTTSFEAPFKGSTTSLGAVGFAFYNGLWAYDGWNNLNYATEELKKPNRDLPLSIIIGMPLVIACYVLVNISYLTVLTPGELMTSGAVAVTMGDRVYGVMAWCIPIFVACSTFGSANGCAFSGGRLTFVAAREGHLPKVLAMVHTTRHTPLPALIFTSILAWLMLIPDSSSFETLLNYFSFAAWVFYGGTISALLWLRYKKPEMKRPYKVWTIIPILVLLASIYLVVAPFYEEPWGSFFCLLFILAGVPIYLFFVYFKLIPKCLSNLTESWTCSLQKICDVYLPDSEDQVMSI